MATVLKKLEFKGRRLTDIFASDIVFLKNELVKGSQGRPDRKVVTCLLNTTDTTFEVEVDDDTPKDVNRYDTIDFTEAEVSISSSGTKSGDFVSASLKISVKAKGFYSTKNKPVEKPAQAK